MNEYTETQAAAATAAPMTHAARITRIAQTDNAARFTAAIFGWLIGDGWLAEGVYLENFTHLHGEIKRIVAAQLATLDPTDMGYEDAPNPTVEKIEHQMELGRAVYGLRALGHSNEDITLMFMGFLKQDAPTESSAMSEISDTDAL